MNKLSWLIYWADTIPHLATWLCFVSFLLFVATVFCLAVGITIITTTDNISDRWNPQTGLYEKVVNTDLAKYKEGLFLKRIGYFAPLFFILWGASFLVPEKNTFYMIAASEAGEQAMQTPEFVKVRKVIDNWLDQNSETPSIKTDDKKKD